MIDINITVLIQLVNFIVAMVVMNILLIRPVREVVKKRRAIATGFLRGAEDFTRQAEEKLAHYETGLAATRAEAAQAHETHRLDALSQEAQLLASAQKEAQDFLQTSREETQAAVATAEKTLRKQVPALATLAASRLINSKHRADA